MPIRHDFRCNKCDAFIENEHVEAKSIKNHYATKLKCPSCGKIGTCYITWESGEAPPGRMKNEYLGDIWDKANINPTSKEYRKRVEQDIKRTKKNA